MGKDRIYVCDDEKKHATEWLEKVQSLDCVTELFEVEMLEDGDLARQIKVLESRRRDARPRDEGGDTEDPRSKTRDRSVEEKTKIDRCSILILDYDLLKISRDYRVTGENVAYLSRCYSECDIIVVVNQFHFGEATFDLTLKGHPESFADLNTSSKFLCNRGLWSDRREGFRPWSWPVLPQWLEKFQERVDEVSEVYDQDVPILEFLGLDQYFEQFPRKALEFLSEEDPRQTTFRGFVEESGNGLRRKDKLKDESSGHRIAAARIAQWLETIVLPSQDILIDAPHLVSRFPSLLKKRDEDLDETAQFKPAAQLPLKNEWIDSDSFEKDSWLSRPAWIWPALSTNEAIPEVQDPWSAKPLEYVFCEDISRFRRPEEAKEFVADLDTVYDRRYVVAMPDEEVNYRPQVRFSL